MKYVDEYRERSGCEACVRAVLETATRRWTLMEVCGGQTHSIVKYGIDELLAPKITLLHGPGCPVCVTPCEMIDKAMAIAALPHVILCSFGDMLRVPGSQRDLLSVKARGGDVRIVYSPLDALRIAEDNPEKQVVFFAVGFETTAPANAMAVYLAQQRAVRNFSMLVSHVLVPPALCAILDSPENRTQGILAAGHVCTIMGCDEYRYLAQRFRVPIVVTGFEPLDILQGILMCVRQLESGRHELENQYARSVNAHGNPHARELMHSVFRVVPRKWRGLGEIQDSGLALTNDYCEFDAELRFQTSDNSCAEPAECISSAVLRGAKMPQDCAAFGTACSPEHPLGALMVSSEGSCAAYFRYRNMGAAAR